MSSKDVEFKLESCKIRFKVALNFLPRIIKRNPNSSIDELVFKALRKSRLLYQVVRPDEDIFDFGNKDKEE